MDRRRLLKGGAAVAGTAGVALLDEGCAHQGPLAEASSLPDVRIIDQVVSSMDRRLAWIDRHRLDVDLAPPLPSPPSPEVSARAEKSELLFRQSMRTLYVTGRFMDLPDEVKTHPAVQARVLDAQAEMDEAVLGTTELLASLRPEDHRAIQATLRAHPELGEKLAKVMDEPAQDDGIPFRRRLSLRTSTMALTDRMKAQSPALTIDPLVRRVRKLAAQPPTGTGTTRLMAAKMGEKAFWEHQQRLAELSTRWERRLAQTTPAAPGPTPTMASPAPAAPAGAVPAPPPSSSGHKALSTGGYIMGFGLGSVGVGLAFAGLNAAFASEAFLWPAVFFGVTLGPILLIVGLVVVLIGGLMVAAE
jgi:hypothetical protein